MKGVIKNQKIVVLFFIFLAIIYSSNAYGAEARMINTNGWGGAFCPCCQSPEATTFIEWTLSDIGRMRCVKCNAVVSLARNANLSYTITNPEGCGSSSQNSPVPSTVVEKATFMKSQVAVARFSTPPLLRVFALHKGSRMGFWENDPNFIETIALDLEIPWGRQFKLNQNNNGQYYLTFELPDSIVPVSQSIPAPLAPPSGLKKIQ